MLWTTPSQVNSLTAKTRPGVVALGDQLHVVAAEQGDGTLYHAIYKDQIWTSTMLSPSSGRSVSLTSFQGGLACAYVTSGTTVALMTWSHDTGTWTSKLTSSFTVSNGVAVAEHSGLIYLVYQDAANTKTLYYCTWNGVDSDWTTPVQINAALTPATNHTPALVSFDGHLYLLFTTAGGAPIQFYRFVGPYVSGEPFVSLGVVAAATSNGMALGATSFNDQLVVLTSTSAGVPSAYAWAYDEWTSLPLPSLSAIKGGVGVASYRGALELLTIVPDGDTYPLTWAQGLRGGERPLGATPLWSCNGAAYASTNLSPNLFWGAQPFTIEAWINAAHLTGTQYIFSNVQVSGGGDPTGLVALALRDGVLSLWFAGRWIAAEGAPLSAADWHHVAASFDGRSVTLLLDGTPYAFAQFTLADVATPPAPTGAVLVGAAASGGGVTGIFSGSISRVAVFDAARDELQVSQDQFTRVHPQASLVALLDFARATPTDDSMQGVTITTAGTPTWLAQTNALHFSGAGGLNCSGTEGTDNLSFEPSEDMSIAAWVMPDAAPSGPATIIYRTGQYVLSVNAALGVIAQAGGGTTYATAGKLVSTSTWTHIAAVFKHGHLNVWVNGTKQSLSATSAVPVTSLNATVIGCRTAGGAPFKGAIATVSVWRRALTHQELAALRAQAPVYLSGLAGSYDFFTTSLDDTSAQNPTPALVGGGLALVLVNEVLSQAACAALEIVSVSASSPFEPEDGIEDIVGWTLPEGQTVAGQRSLTSEQAVWLIKLLLTIVLGFAGILGVSAGSKLAGKLQSYLTKYQSRIVRGLNRYFGGSSKWRQYGDDAVAVLLALAANAPGVALDALLGLIANVVLDMLKGLWDEGVLKSMFKIIGDNLSWWDLANLLLNLAAFFIPGANAAKIASILIQLAIMAEQLIRLALSYPHPPKGARAEAAALADGAKRSASLEAQLALA